jgi:hypothetical protein
MVQSRGRRDIERIILSAVNALQIDKNIVLYHIRRSEAGEQTLYWSALSNLITKFLYPGRVVF